MTITIGIGVAGRADVGIVATELTGVVAALLDELVAELGGVELLGCASGCRLGAVTGALRGGVVPRFVVCANDAGEDASERAICNRTSLRGRTNKLDGGMDNLRGKELQKRFIRELTVFEELRLKCVKGNFQVNDTLRVSVIDNVRE